MDDLILELDNIISGAVVGVLALIGVKVRSFSLKRATRKTIDLTDNLKELADRPLSEVVSEAVFEASDAQYQRVTEMFEGWKTNLDARDKATWAKHDDCHERIETWLRELAAGQAAIRAELGIHTQPPPLPPAIPGTPPVAKGHRTWE